MRHALLLFLQLLVARVIALPLFPVLSNVPVAITTNREVARGMAFDGTNLLVVFQGDNLYPGASLTNQLAAQLISTNGELVGQRIDLQLNGSIPLVAFGGTNHLMVWVDAANPVPGIYGQFLDRAGARFGSAFLIHSNAIVGEVSAIEFAFGQYFVAWAATSAANNAGRIAARRVDSFGTLLGNVLELGTTTSDAQRFPALAVGDTNLLMTWSALRTDTNLWNVMGRLIQPNGNVSSAFVISQTSAWDAYPSAAAFGGSNYLVAWSREAEPWCTFFLGAPNGQPIYVDRLFPMLFARLMSSSGEMRGDEYPISRARWGQFSPSIAFADTNFLVVWNDRRFSTYENYTLSPPRFREEITWASVVFARFVGMEGYLSETEFSLHDVSSTFPVYANSLLAGPKCLAVGDSAVVLRGRINSSGATNADVSMITVRREPQLPPTISVIGITNGAIRLRVGSISSSCFLAVNDPTQWPTSTNLFWFGPMQNIFFNWPRRDFIDVPLTAEPRFFRAVDGTEPCKANLRKIMWAKEQWALDFGGAMYDAPTPWQMPSYPRPIPFCPENGAYTLHNVRNFPLCNVYGHRLP